MLQIYEYGYSFCLSFFFIKYEEHPFGYRAWDRWQDLIPSYLPLQNRNLVKVFVLSSMIQSRFEIGAWFSFTEWT